MKTHKVLHAAQYKEMVDARIARGLYEALEELTAKCAHDIYAKSELATASAALATADGENDE